MARYPQIYDEIGYALRERAHKHSDLAFRFDSAVRAVRIAETVDEERRALWRLQAVHSEVIAAQGAELERACRAYLRLASPAAKAGANVIDRAFELQAAADRAEGAFIRAVNRGFAG